MRIANCSLLVCSLSCLWGSAPARGQGFAPTSATIRRWIKELDSDQFRIREEATRNLRRAGPAVFQPLAEAAAGSSMEVTLRAMSILKEGFRAKDTRSAKAARVVVTALLDSTNQAAAAHARAILAGERDDCIALLEKAGVGIIRDASITGLVFDNDKHLDGHLGCLQHFPDVEMLSLSNRSFGNDQMPYLKHLRQLREINFYRSSIGDDALKHFKHFPRLKRIPMGETHVTDAGVAHLKDLINLEYVGLRGNHVTDAGVAHLSGLTNLTGLYLGETKITDAGLIHLKNLKQLNTLYLGKTAVTDRGLEHLFELSQLTYLDLTDTKVTDAGVAKLREKISRLRIERTKSQE